MRASGRAYDAVRPVIIHRGFLKSAEGSVLIEMGNTRVICTATVSDGVPKFLYGKGRGWLTGEYGMLPRSSPQRIMREAIRGRGGRTYEIQRLIGRSLRAATQLNMLGEVTVIIDCDVIEADGGTRGASITGGCVALYDALSRIGLPAHPMNFLASAISVGIVGGKVMLDLEYSEDSTADVDLNVVMSEGGAFIEIQGTAEQVPFSNDQLGTMLEYARKGCMELVEAQKKALGL
jgi:ribonuclease PH